MVKCLLCQGLIPGAWTLDPNSSEEGSLTGLDCYFGNSEPNLLHYYCKQCYANGKFTEALKQMYQVPVQSIINGAISTQQIRIQELEALNNGLSSAKAECEGKLNAAETKDKQLTRKYEQLQIRQKQLQAKDKQLETKYKQLQVKQKQKQARNQELQIKNRELEVQVKKLQTEATDFTIQSKYLVSKSVLILKAAQDYQKQLETKLKIAPFKIQEKLIAKITALVELQKRQFKGHYTNKLNQLKLKTQQSLKALKLLQSATLESLLSAQDTSTSDKMFSDQQRDSCDKIFSNKKLAFEVKLEIIASCMNKINQAFYVPIVSTVPTQIVDALQFD